MADANIKKYRIPIGSLPAINSVSEGYTARYRIISEDRNRLSHWSPLYLLIPEYTNVVGAIGFHKTGSIANIVWDSVEVTKTYNSKTYSITRSHEYDIWVRWDRGDGDGDWIYKERIDTTSLSLPIPSTWTIDGIVQPDQPNRFSVEVYLRGWPIERSDGPAGTPFLKVYRLLNETV